MDAKAFIYKKLRERTKVKFDDQTNVFDVGIDSLDLVVLVSEIESELKLKVSDESLSKIVTVSDVVLAVEAAQAVKQNQTK